MIKILLVEDEFLIARLLQRNLQLVGYEVCELASSGEEALERAEQEQPDVILMDEPCSALDPIATLRIEELMRELSAKYTIVIVTHNMQQAARVSDYTAMMMLGEDRAGELIEFDKTEVIFTRPKNPRTEDYVTGRFG